MNHDKIYAWLGLPQGNWPPDHYTLLGLKPGEGDIARIEQHVHERLAKLRSYQLSHPEQATEAMNRLAQAFMCLTDPEAKKCYDRLSCGKTAETAAVEKVQQSNGSGPAMPPSAPVPVPAPASLDDTAVKAQTQVDWKNSPPPPVRQPISAQPASPVTPAAAINGNPAGQIATPPAASTASAAPLSQPADALFEAAHASPEARRGLGTVPALIERIYLTRQVLWAWEQVGKYLNKPKRRLTRIAEQKDLTGHLREVGELMEGFPRILGQPGQPGYRVVAMARLEMTAVMFNMLDPRQREALARDWLAGRVLLMAHRHFLRRELRYLRNQSWLSRGLRAVRAALNDHPLRVLLAVSLTALVIALFHLLFP